MSNCLFITIGQNLFELRATKSSFLWRTLKDLLKCKLQIIEMNNFFSYIPTQQNISRSYYLPACCACKVTMQSLGQVCDLLHGSLFPPLCLLCPKY